MGKKEELKTLDDQVRKLMLKATSEEGDTSILKDLTVVANYLAKNQVLAEKEKGTLEEDIERRLKEAEERRKAQS